MITLFWILGLIIAGTAIVVWLTEEKDEMPLDAVSEPRVEEVPSDGAVAVEDTNK